MKPGESAARSRKRHTPACVVVLDKAGAHDRAQVGTGVFMIDASKGFTKDGNKNRLRSQDIHKIVDVFTRGTELSGYSRLVPLEEIAGPKNNYNLNLPRYVDSSEPDDFQDLHAHLHGGIPARDVEALARYWDAFPQMRSTLFEEVSRSGYCRLKVDVGDVHQTILDSSEFKAFQTNVIDRVKTWFTAHLPALEAIDANTVPNDLITEIGDDLLACFNDVPLLDPYDVYEQLMSYWHDTMHDDVFLVMNEGWRDAAQPRRTIEDKDRKLSESPDLVIGSGKAAAKYKTDLIQPALIVSRFFADEHVTVEKLDFADEEASRAVEEYLDEHAVEDGLLAEAMDDGKTSKALAVARLKDAKREGSDPDEVDALHHLIQLYVAQGSTRKAAKDAQASLDLVTLEKYGQLTLQEVKQLLLDDKWQGVVSHKIVGVLEELLLAMLKRIKELGYRYERTLDQIDLQISQLNLSVSDKIELLTGGVRLTGFVGEWQELPIGTLLSYEQPGKYLVTTTKQLDSGRVPVLTAGKTFVLGYTNDVHGIYRSYPVIIFDDFTTASQYVDFDFKAKSSAMKILSARPGVADVRFMFELMQLINFVVGDHKRHWISEYSKILVHVPGIEEQRAIARTVGEFDSLMDATSARVNKLRGLKKSAMQRLISGNGHRVEAMHE